MPNPVSSGFLAPPVAFIVLCLLGALLGLRWRRTGIAVCLIASAALWATATPALSSWLLQQVESSLPATADFRAAQAVVVLGGDMRSGDWASATDALGPGTLERVFLAARAYRQLRLPVAVSGGPGTGSFATAADLMKRALEEDFGVPVAWNENRSSTTYENALFTKRLLPPGITTVVVVTQAPHLPRALRAFERVGLRALPWPAPRTPLRVRRFDDYLPAIGGVMDSYTALHEWVGNLYYQLRY